MNTKKILNATQAEDPDLMRKIIIANDVTFTECINQIKRCKAIINFHTSTYVYGQKDLYNGVELTGALVDLSQACELITNRINEI